MEDIVTNASDGRRKSRAAPVRVVLPDGSLFEMPPEYSKLSNANIKNIPRDLYRLQVMCQQRHLFAAVTQKPWPDGKPMDHFVAAGLSFPRLFDHDPATLPEGGLAVACMCGASHPVDLPRAFRLADERAALHPRRRVCDASDVSPTP